MHFWQKRYYDDIFVDNSRVAKFPLKVFIGVHGSVT